MFYIYCIEIIPTGKKYVGCTSNVLRRWKQHTKNYGDTKVGQAIKSAGISNISVNVLDLHDDIKDALASEQSFIRNLNTLEPNGYNQRSGSGNINIDLLCNMYERGDSTKSICSVFKCSWGVLLPRLHDAGVKIRREGRNWGAKASAKQVKADRASGMKIKEIMDKHSISRDTVYRRLAE